MKNFKGSILVYLAIFILNSFVIIFQESFALIPLLNNEIEQYGLFEQQFVAHSNYNNPYVQVSLTAHVSGPAGITFDVEGYWYGGKSWRLRIMPTAVGHWTYTTSSNDSYLNGLSGEFDCISSSRPGILIVNPDYPYTFKLSEGEPFFWMGETSWLLMSNGVPFNDSTFHKLINKRLTQKFNGIHFVLGTGGLPVGTHNPENEGGYLWISQDEQRINPEFFIWVDKRIAYLDSVEMAIGFFITWAQHFTTFTQQEFERFERYLIARYSAYPQLYWVIVGEFDEAGTIDDYNYHGRVIDEKDPYGHLISNLPNHNDSQNLGTNRIFVGQDWFSFIMQQLPQHPVTTSPAEVHNYIITDRIYNIPVVNAEFGYEGKDNFGNMMTSDFIRKYAWAIVLGGGFLSYGHAETIRQVNLNATNSDGALYMGYLYDFFKGINWWEMNPDPDKVDNGFFLSRPAPEYLIYLPDGGVVNIDLTEDLCTFEAKWYNPKDGTYEDALPIVGGTVQPCTSIYNQDAVLHLSLYLEPIVQLETKILLEGPYDANQDIMTTAINELTLFRRPTNCLQHTSKCHGLGAGAIALYCQWLGSRIEKRLLS